MRDTVNFALHLRGVAGWAAWVACFILAGKLLAQSAVPCLPVDGNYLREWLLLDQPIAPTEAVDFLTQFSRAAEVALTRGEPVAVPGGRDARWVRREARSRSIVFRDGGETSHPDKGVMLMCYLEHPVAGTVEFQICSYANVSAYLNGKQLDRTYQYLSDRQTRIPFHVFEGELRSGTNSLLLWLPSVQSNSKLFVRALPPTRAVVSGELRRKTGVFGLQPVDLVLRKDRQDILELTTANTASYRCSIFPVVEGAYEINAFCGPDGVQGQKVVLNPGSRINLDLWLTNTTSISGHAFMLDPEETPHAGVLVQAWRDLQPVASAFTGERGTYRLINLPPGRYQVCSVTPQGPVFAARGEITLALGQSVNQVDLRFPPFKKGAWTKYDTFDGLAHNNTMCMRAAADGTLLVGTEGGVSRFDGRRFTTLPGSEGQFAQCLDLLADGTIWYGTLRGLFRYQAGKTTHFTVRDGLCHPMVNAVLALPDGTVYVGTEAGLSIFDGQNFLNYFVRDGLIDNSVRSFHRGSDGRIWIGTSAGLTRFDGTRFHNYTAWDTSHEPDIHSIIPDESGGLWLAGWGDLYRFDGTVCRSVIKGNELPDRRVFTIHRSTTGRLWLGFEAGLMAFDGASRTHYTTVDGLPGGNVKGLWESPGGIIWLATDKGVARFDPHLSQYTTRDGLSGNRVLKVFVDSTNELWAGLENNGIARFEGGKFAAMYPSAYIRDICRSSDGVLWFGANDRILRHDGEWFLPEDLSQHQWILALCADPDGSVWVGHGWGGGGVDRLRKDERGKYVPLPPLTTADGLASDDVYAILRARNGVMWFGTGSGLSRFDGQRWTTFSGANSPIHNRRVWSLLEHHDGTIWAGTENGLMRCDGREVRKCATYGPLNDHIWCLYLGKDERLWIGTANSGLGVYDGTACATIDTRDGLGGNSVMSICEAEGGGMWLATRGGGITRYEPKSGKPQVRIESVELAGKTYADTADLPGLALGKHVAFKYQTLDLVTLPLKQQYRIRLTDLTTSAPASEPQVYSTSETRFDWTPEQPGRYYLEVQSIGRDLNYSSPARFELSVYTPWFQQSWIMIPSGVGVAALLLLSILLGHRYFMQRRVSRRLQAQMLEQERQARRQLEDQNHQLEEALASIKTLKGLIPICAHCKKIRDDRGYWQQVESYVMKHSDAQFSHGICPECVKTHFPSCAAKGTQTT